MRLPSTAARASGVERPLYVIKTGGTVFGVHRPAADFGRADDCTTTHIVGFRRRLYADVLAESLESYRARTGTFPSRDDVAGGLDCLATIGESEDGPGHADAGLAAAAGDGAEVEVEEVNVAAMVSRLEGTGMTLTVVYEDAAGELAWVDVRPRNDVRAVIGALDALYNDGVEDPVDNGPKNNAVPAPTRGSAGGSGGSADRNVPPLLPKPVRKMSRTSSGGESSRTAEESKLDFAAYAAMAEARLAMTGTDDTGTTDANERKCESVPPAMAPAMLWATAWLAADRRRKRRSRPGVTAVARLLVGVLRWMGK